MDNSVYYDDQKSLHPDWLQFLVDEQQQMWLQHCHSNQPVEAIAPLSGQELFELEMYRQYLDNLFTMDEMANHVIRTTVPRFTPPPSYRVVKSSEDVALVDGVKGPSAGDEAADSQNAITLLISTTDDNDDEIELIFEKRGVPGTEARTAHLKKKKKKKKKRGKKRGKGTIVAEVGDLVPAPAAPSTLDEHIGNQSNAAAEKKTEDGEKTKEKATSSSTTSALIDGSSTTVHSDALDACTESQMDNALEKETEAREELEIHPSTSQLPLIDGATDNGEEAVMNMGNEKEQIQPTEVAEPLVDDLVLADAFSSSTYPINFKEDLDATIDNHINDEKENEDGEDTKQDAASSSTPSGPIDESTENGAHHGNADAQLRSGCHNDGDFRMDDVGEADGDDQIDDREGFEDVCKDEAEEQPMTGLAQRVLRSATRTQRPPSFSSSSDTDSESDFDGEEEEKENDEDNSNVPSGSADRIENIVIPPSKRFIGMDDRKWEKKVAASEKYTFTSRNVWMCPKPKKEFLPDPSSDTCESLREARIACPVNCPAKKCMNNFLRKPNMKMFIGSTEYGNGLFAAEPFRMRDGIRKILEYTGEIRDNEQWRDHIVKMKKKRPNYGRYVVQMSGFTCDPELVGNSGRMSNHSCDPNCMLEVFYVDGIPRLFLIPLRDIDEGEQLMWFYGGAFLTGIDGAGDKPEEIPCKCKAANCQGIVGGRFGGPTKIPKKSLEPEIKEKRKRTRNSNIAEEAEKQRKEEAIMSKKIKAQQSSRGDRAEKRSSMN